MKKKMVIFGAGYVGHALAVRAVACGWQVWAVTRNATRAADLRASGVIVAEALLTERSRWEPALPAKPDGVVNLVSSADRTVAGYRASYIDGQTQVLDWAGEAGAARYLYSSSTSVYGEADGGWVDESIPPDPTTVFAEILVEAEDRVASALLDATILRLGGIYGPGRHLLWNQVREAQGSHLPGFGDIYLNLIHRDDIVGAILAALDKRGLSRRLFNIVDGHPATRQQIVDWICREQGRDRLVYDPERAAEDGRGARFEAGRRPNRRIRSAFAAEELGWIPGCADFMDGYRKLGLAQSRDAG